MKLFFNHWNPFKIEMLGIAGEATVGRTELYWNEFTLKPVVFYSEETIVINPEDDEEDEDIDGLPLLEEEEDQVDKGV